MIKKNIKLIAAMATITLLSLACSENTSNTMVNPGGKSGSESSPSASSITASAQEIPEPPVLRSQNGELKATLEAAPSKVTVAGKTFVSNVFNSLYIPPVLIVKRGDEVRLEFVNNIAKADIKIDGPQTSNIHTHGMAISPLQPADNVYIGIPSGAKGPLSRMEAEHAHDYEASRSFPDGAGYAPPNGYKYRWTVPTRHALGPHWYHPHAHGMVEPQVLSGMSGLLIIDGFVETHYPELADLTIRHFLLKDIELPDHKDGDPLTKSINGLSGGIIRMRPGEVQIWQIGNIGANAFFDLALEGHSLFALSHDANVLTSPEPMKNVFLPPGARITLAVTAGKAGSYALRSMTVDTDPAGDPNPEVVLASLIVEGDPVASENAVARLTRPAVRLDDISPTVEAVESMPVKKKRTIRFSETSDGKTFFIDGREFDANRDDITVTVGDVEEWTLINKTGERHVFHIHQIDFLVESINDNDPYAEGLRDTVDMPYARKGVPGKVVLKMPFINPDIVGRFPYHCHILEHEDNGMMATLRVLPAGSKPAHTP